MEGDKAVQGFGWVLLGWLVCLLALFLVLALLPGCFPEPEKADSGAICMTAESLDAQLSASYADGYAKAKAEIVPTTSLKLYQNKEAVQELMDCTLCERCTSTVPDEEGNPDASCMDRASCLLSIARGKGYLGYIAVMNFTSDYSHAIVMFPTVDDGNVFVEPWYDKIVPTPIVGQTYIDKRNIIEKVAY